MGMTARGPMARGPTARGSTRRATRQSLRPFLCEYGGMGDANTLYHGVILLTSEKLILDIRWYTYGAYVLISRMRLRVLRRQRQLGMI